jgi:hypothetical protein
VPVQLPAQSDNEGEEEEESQENGSESIFSDSESGGASEGAAERPAQAHPSSSPLRHGAGASAGGMAGRHRSRAPHHEEFEARSLQQQQLHESQCHAYELETSPTKRFKGNPSASHFHTRSPDSFDYTRNLLPF